MWCFHQIQKAVVDHDQQPVTMTIFWCKFGFGKCSGTSSQSNHWAGHCQLSNKIHFSSHITIWLKNGSLLLSRIREDDTSEWFFFICGQVMKPSLIKLFHLSNLLQMPNNCWMVDIKFFSNFYSCKRISFNLVGSQFDIVNFRWPAATLLIFKALVSFAKHLEPPLHCTFIAVLGQMRC